MGSIATTPSRNMNHLCVWASNVDAMSRGHPLCLWAAPLSRVCACAHNMHSCWGSHLRSRRGEPIRAPRHMPRSYPGGLPRDGLWPGRLPLPHPFPSLGGPVMSLTGMRPRKGSATYLSNTPTIFLFPKRLIQLGPVGVPASSPAVPDSYIPNI